MIDEKKLASAAMSDNELDNVAGGTVRESREIFQVLSQKKCSKYGLA